MVFSIFILRYVESKFTLLTYLMENNTVITVISYCTKGLNNSKTKQKPIPTIHNKTLFRLYGICPCKHFVREKLQGWYAGEVEKKINAGQNTSDIPIEMGIQVMRELTSR